MRFKIRFNVLNVVLHVARATLKYGGCSKDFICSFEGVVLTIDNVLKMFLNDVIIFEVILNARYFIIRWNDFFQY